MQGFKGLVSNKKTMCSETCNVGGFPLLVSVTGQGIVQTLVLLNLWKTFTLKKLLVLNYL